MNEIRYPWCPKCNENFPMRDETMDGYERSGSTFYCPKGHGLVIRQDDVVSQLRTSERFLRRSEDQVHKLEKKIEGVKGVITRQRNRLVRGCCPYCAKNVSTIDERSMLRHIHDSHSKL